MWGPGWGPMYGWWVMPFFGIIFLVIVLLIVTRFRAGLEKLDRDISDKAALN